MSQAAWRVLLLALVAFALLWLTPIGPLLLVLLPVFLAVFAVTFVAVAITLFPVYWFLRWFTGT